jgi:hypothetical protein
MSATRSSVRLLSLIASVLVRYADAIHTILTLPPAQQLAIQVCGITSYVIRTTMKITLQVNARASVSDRFSEQAFAAQFLQHLSPLLTAWE